MEGGIKVVRSEVRKARGVGSTVLIGSCLANDICLIKERYSNIPDVS